ncbi:MAG: hypothetical protein M1309_00245 [Actinobacteria bacterium]|nr:hypothetical protein [Actinomycetota bacterium]
MEFVAIIIFVVTIAAIVWERFHITAIALAGGMAMRPTVPHADPARGRDRRRLGVPQHLTTVMLVAPAAVMTARGLEVDAISSRWCR